MLKVSQMNVRSAVNKAVLIHDVIADHRIDLVGVTETWIFLGAPDAIKLDIALFGYRVLQAYTYHGLSEDKRGGGVAIIHRENIPVMPIGFGRFTDFEYLSLKVLLATSPCLITCVYWPAGQPSTSFFDQLSYLIDQGLLTSRRDR